MQITFICINDKNNRNGYVHGQGCKSISLFSTSITLIYLYIECIETITFFVRIISQKQQLIALKVDFNSRGN